jgi:hypothetical protein
MVQSIRLTLEQFTEVLSQLPEDVYIMPCPELSNATIGQHSRHIIELFQCLISGYGLGTVCYDNRKRNKQTEEDLPFALTQIREIHEAIDLPDLGLNVQYQLNNSDILIPSNYRRELMYNLEHLIHHEALIKVAITSMTEVAIPESFGVAPSTLQYRKECAQ